MRVEAYIKLLRPRHWLKNLFLFAAPFFGGALLREDVLSLAPPVFFAFSFAASGVYIFNDLIDRQRDRLHPSKSLRPIASGIISYKIALMILLFLMCISLFISYVVGRGFLIYILLYLSIQIAYSLKIRHFAILDIFFIAAGFVVRVMAGGKAFHIEVSPWLFTTMFMISLVLASGKRLSESGALKENASLHRESLRDYSMAFLRTVLILSSGTSLVTYALYTVEQSPELIYTIPVVTFGLLRYLMISERGLGDATEALTKDIHLAVAVLLWLGLVGFLRYLI